MNVFRVLRARSRYLVAGAMILGTAFMMFGCENSLKVEYNLPGTWEGYIGLGQQTNQVAVGDLTMIVDNQRNVSVSGVITGSWDVYGGEFTLTFEGNPILRVQEDIYGEITMTRYRPGIDTTAVTVLFTGLFSEHSVSCFGDWQTVSGSVFSGTGTWTVAK